MDSQYPICCHPSLYNNKSNKIGRGGYDLVVNVFTFNFNSPVQILLGSIIENNEKEKYGKY